MKTTNFTSSEIAQLEVAGFKTNKSTVAEVETENGIYLAILKVTSREFEVTVDDGLDSLTFYTETLKEAIESTI
jgi:hypothetical protein